MMTTQEERNSQRERHHQPLTHTLENAIREAGWAVPEMTQSSLKSGDNNTDGNASINNSRANKETFMNEQTQQTETQNPSTQTPPPAGGTDTPMSAFQRDLQGTVSATADAALKSYFTQRRTAVMIDVAAFAVKGAIVVGVVSASLAIGNAILSSKVPEALPPSTL